MMGEDESGGRGGRNRVVEDSIRSVDARLRKRGLGSEVIEKLTRVRWHIPAELTTRPGVYCRVVWGDEGDYFEVLMLETGGRWLYLDPDSLGWIECHENYVEDMLSGSIAPMVRLRSLYTSVTPTAIRAVKGVKTEGENRE